MVRKKVLSKRLTLKDKYKIKKRVAQHEKKKRKEARANPKARSKLSKDPGVPNLWPQQQEMMKKMSDESKEMLIEKKEQEKNSKRKRTEEDKLTEMALTAQRAANEHDSSLQFKSLGAFNIRSKESSKKNFFKEFKKVVKMADVVLEVLDARDPLGCRSYTTEQQILQLDPNKKIILVLNKIDLIPKENLDKWLAYLRNSYPTIAFKASTQKQMSNLSRSEKSLENITQDELATSKCFGANTLISLLKNYCRSKDLKTAISVGVIGFPNVGKSSIINSLKRSRAVNVGPIAGVTKQAQEVSLDKLIKLIDCPGVVFSSDMSESDAALRNCINPDQLNDFILPVQSILQKVSKESLEALYKIPAFGGPTDFLGHVAKRRCKLGNGGVLNYQEAARQVLLDWNSGKIPYYCIPPDVDPSIHGEAKIVSQWSEEFKFDNVMEMEQKEISMMDYDVARFLFTRPTTSSPVVADKRFGNLGDDDEDEMAVTWNKESTLTVAPIKEKKEKSHETPPKKVKVDPEATPSLAELKKAEKQRAKKERKALAGGEAMDSEVNKSEAYDFSVDFWKNPMTRVTTNNTNDFNTNAASSTASNFFSQFNEMNEEESGESSDDEEDSEGEEGSDEESDESDGDDVR